MMCRCLRWLLDLILGDDGPRTDSSLLDETQEEQTAREERRRDSRPMR